MNLNGKKIFEVVNEINGERIKKQTEQQSAQCVQEQCIILILSQKHLEKRHRLEAKSMQGLKWHSQENGGWNQDGWWDYAKRDQETWQARTKVKNHWEVLDTCSAWTEMLKKVFRVVNLCTHPLARTEKATGNKAKARTRFSFLGHPQHSHPARCHHGQLHLGTPPRPELLISLKVAQLSVPSLFMGLPLHSHQQTLHPPWARQTLPWEGASSEASPTAQGSEQVPAPHSPSEQALQHLTCI